MSGVFGQRFGRRNVDHERSCSTSSTSSARRVLPGEVRVALGEARSFASDVIIAGRVNASERKIVSGCAFRTSPISHSQNGDRLRVRVVDAEDRHAGLAPVQHDVAERLPERLPVGRLPVDVVDVLVALGRVLRVLDRPVGPSPEPLGMRRSSHGWSGEHCTAKSSAISSPCSRATATSASKSARVPSAGSIASCPPSWPPIAHGLPDITGQRGGSALFRPLRFVTPDRVDRREVDDVESEPRELRDDVRDARAARPTSAGRARTTLRYRARSRSTSTSSVTPRAASCRSFAPRPTQPRASRRRVPGPNRQLPFASSLGRST